MRYFDDRESGLSISVRDLVPRRVVVEGSGDGVSQFDGFVDEAYRRTAVATLREISNCRPWPDRTKNETMIGAPSAATECSCPGMQPERSLTADMDVAGPSNDDCVERTLDGTRHERRVRSGRTARRSSVDR